MSASDFLKSALGAIDSNSLIAEFVSDRAVVECVADSCELLALWCNELISCDPENLACPFLMEIQRASHDVAALLALALYVPAAASMRASCEAALYYSYFRTHSTELATLASCPSYFISKKEIIEFHKDHTVGYQKGHKIFGFPGILDRWYSQTSAIIHGQLPGTWGRRLALADTRHDSIILNTAVTEFRVGVSIINLFLLMTAGFENWSNIHHTAKMRFLKGLSPEDRAALCLDGKRQ